jgi:excinuclease ABC subunit A
LELLFLPSVYAPCPTCHGARYNAKTPESRSLHVLGEVGLGYLRLGPAATELSGGEAQRIKLATELQRQQRGPSPYVLDEPTTGLHPSDVEKLVAQLHGLVNAGNTVVVVEHDMHVIAGSDWVDRHRPRRRRGKAAASSAPVRPPSWPPAPASRTAAYLARELG